MSMTPDDVDSAATLEGLLMVLRRYADSPLGTKLADALNEIGQSCRDSLPAMEWGSEERHVEAILAMTLTKLSILVLDLRLEIGSARLDARGWLEDLDPGDFGPSSFGESS